MTPATRNWALRILFPGRNSSRAQLRVSVHLPVTLRDLECSASPRRTGRAPGSASKDCRKPLTVWESWEVATDPKVSVFKASALSACLEPVRRPAELECPAAARRALAS